MCAFHILGGIEEISADLPDFRLELKFKAQNLSRLKWAWAFNPEIHFRVKICLKTETPPYAVKDLIK